MKRIACILLALLTLLPLCRGALALEPLTGDAVPISAPSAILMEKTTGTVLYEKDADRRLPPASVTKLMTMLLIMEALESGKITLTDTVTASARAASFGGSCVYLEQGEQMSVEEMLKCIAVASANDCAVAMAEHLCGTEELFVERMNRRSEELGLENTHFSNCTGLFEDPEHYSSARDLALISRELLRHEDIKRFTGIWMDSIRGGAFGLSNTNKLLVQYQGCTGLKTGFTNAAMYCVSATAEREGVEYIAVVMHADTSDARNIDASTLLNYAFANFRLCSLRPEEPLPELPVDMGREERVALVIDGPETALIPKGGAAASCRLELPELLRAPVREGQELGTLVVSLEDEELARLPLRAASEVPRVGFLQILTRLAGSLVGL